MKSSITNIVFNCGRIGSSRRNTAVRALMSSSVTGGSNRIVGAAVSSFPYPAWKQTPQTLLRRSFAESSHDDFAPKRKAVVEGADEALNMIQEHVKSNAVMLYMKGSPQMPMCGFSAQVVQVLKAEGVDFSSVNVLDYPAIREGVKKFSDWPTIPQLYVNGEFIGGCDIVVGMHQSGELKELLKEIKEKSEK